MNTTENIAKEKAYRSDRSEQWRAATLYRYSYALDGWLEDGNVTIKPQESIRATTREIARAANVSSDEIQLVLFFTTPQFVRPASVRFNE